MSGALVLSVIETFDRTPYKYIGKVTMAGPRPYFSIGIATLPEPYLFIGIVTDGPGPYLFIGIATLPGPYLFIGIATLPGPYLFIGIATLPGPYCIAPVPRAWPRSCKSAPSLGRTG